MQPPSSWQVSESLRSNNSYTLSPRIWGEKVTPRKRRRMTPAWKHRLRRWVRVNFAQALLEAARDFEAGKISQPEYDRIKEGLPFRLRDAMMACGMDFSNRYDYARAQGFFAEERKRLENALVVFIQDPRYAQMKKRGATENEIFAAFMLGALEHNVYPLFADPDDDNRFKVLERPDYLYILQLRTSAIASEVGRRTGELNALDPHFALKPELQRPALRDGAMFQLPPPSERECPYGCGLMLPDNQSLVQHIEANHFAGATPP